MDKILVVEDEEIVRNNIVELLENENFNVVDAENVMIALNKMQNELPDLILSDIMMPYFNGFEFYEAVHTKYPDKNIPFLFLTAKMDQGTIKHAMEIGVDDFIIKPYSADNLLKRINSRLEKKKLIDNKFEKLKLDISLYVPHELKTPLIPILGLSELLITDFDKFTDKEKMEMLASIHRSGLRFKERIEKFNKYSELTIQNYETEKSPTQIFNPIDSDFRVKTKRSFQCAKRYKNIDFSFKSAELKITKSDFDAMLFELVENACKFSPPGTDIKVLCKVEAKEYKVQVISFGKKIEDNVFDGFYQMRKNYNQQIGNGLGYAIIQLILKKYNAKLQFNYDGKKRNIITILFPTLIK